jgi:hypothetical protein
MDSGYLLRTTARAEGLGSEAICSFPWAKVSSNAAVNRFGIVAAQVRLNLSIEFQHHLSCPDGEDRLVIREIYLLGLRSPMTELPKARKLQPDRSGSCSTSEQEYSQ